MGKLRITEEFLWQLHELLEGISNANKALTPRSWKDIANPEWRELRLVYERKKRKKSFSQFMSYLKHRGYVKVPIGEGVGMIRLTEKGEKKAREGEKRGRVLAPRKDGKMIMLMYDIPKSKESVRQMFRSAIEFLDYQMLQKSVWISDKDVLEDTERVAREYGLQDCINLFVIEKIRLRGIG
jgi:hypothetical protein